MTQDVVIKRLNACGVSWRKAIESAENCTSEAIRWRISKQTLFASTTTREALCLALRAAADELDDLAATIEALPVTPRQAISEGALVTGMEKFNLLSARFPGHSFYKGHAGHPDADGYLRSLGLIQDPKSKWWYRPKL